MTDTRASSSQAPAALAEPTSPSSDRNSGTPPLTSFAFSLFSASSFRPPPPRGAPSARTSGPTFKRTSTPSRTTASSAARRRRAECPRDHALAAAVRGGPPRLPPTVPRPGSLHLAAVLTRLRCMEHDRGSSIPSAQGAQTPRRSRRAPRYRHLLELPPFFLPALDPRPSGPLSGARAHGLMFDVRCSMFNTQIPSKSTSTSTSTSTSASASASASTASRHLPSISCKDTHAYL